MEYGISWISIQRIIDKAIGEWHCVVAGGGQFEHKM